MNHRLVFGWCILKVFIIRRLIKKMKQLILIRHAKSSWNNLGLKDIERPLNGRGKNDAPLMAELVSESVDPPDLILCSTSKRTRQTVKYFSDSWKLPKDKIFFLDAIYHASAEELLFLIRRIDESIFSAAIVGHNPGLTYLVDELVSSGAPENMPTCGVAVLRSSSEYWSNFDSERVELIKYFYPKGDLNSYN